MVNLAGEPGLKADCIISSQAHFQCAVIPSKNTGISM